MSIRELNKKLNIIMKKDFYPYLEQYGFVSKKNFSYRIMDNCVVQYAVVEKSRWNVGDRVYFDLDLYVAYGSFTPGMKIVSEMDLIKGGETTVFRRLGELDPNGGVRFALSETTDEHAFAKKLCDRFSAVALPFFERTKTLDGMIEFFLDEEKSLGAGTRNVEIGILYCIKNDFVNGRKYIMEAPGEMEYKIINARRFGLDLTLPQ